MPPPSGNGASESLGNNTDFVYSATGIHTIGSDIPTSGVVEYYGEGIFRGDIIRPNYFIFKCRVVVTVDYESGTADVLMTSRVPPLNNCDISITDMELSGSKLSGDKISTRNGDTEGSEAFAIGGLFGIDPEGGPDEIGGVFRGEDFNAEFLAD